MSKLKSQAIKLNNNQLDHLRRVEFEMLVEIDRICRKYDIKYSLDGGTLLGAVRHKGFIPWDDDIDVIMLRNEYEKFYCVCKKELDKSRFFLQEYRTDKHYLFGYEKIRRKNSIFKRVGQEHLKQYGGIFVDIFVADNVPDDPIARNIHLFLCFLIRKGLYSENGRKSEDSVFMKSIYELVSFIPRNFWFATRNLIASICNKNKTELVRHMTHNYRKECRYGMPAVCFENYVDLEFEGKKFKAFRDYDLYLSTLYGDYMKLPPVEQRVSHLQISELKFPD